MRVMPRVKICGIRRPDDAQLACELGADALGFIFWPDSPRFIDPYRARRIVAALPPFVTAIGVFVDQPVEYVAGVAGLVKLGAVQLHGRESTPAYLRAGLRVIKSVAVGGTVDPAAVLEGLPPTVTVLLDAHDPVRRGGTGRTIDWTSAARLARVRPVILSGGLTPENAGEAVAQVRPYGVDVSSGVESAPAVKDAEKLRRFFDAVSGTEACRTQ